MATLEDLLLRWEENLLHAGESEELKKLLTDPANREALVAHFQTSETLLSHFLAEGRQPADGTLQVGRPAAADGTAGGSIVLRPATRRRWLALAAAACLAIVAGVWWLKPDAGLGLRVAEAAGEVNIQHSTLNIQRPSGEGKAVKAVVGMEIRQGDRVVVGKGGKVALKYDGEETRIELVDASAAGFGAENGAKRVKLDGGTLVCMAAAQKMPLEIKTFNAVARVVGTQFTLEANAEDTRIQVMAGVVLSFDYWVKKQTGAIDVYFWNGTRSVSSGFTLMAPAQEQWSHVVMRLSDFKQEFPRDGDLISDLNIQTTPGGNELFVDNIRIEMEKTR